MILPRWLTKTDGTKTLIVSGVLCIVFGALSLAAIIAATVLLNSFGIAIENAYENHTPIVKYLLMTLDYITPIIEIVIGVLAFHFAKHKEKSGLAILSAMILIGATGLGAMISGSIAEKITIYISMVVPYLYYLGGLKHQAAFQRAEKQANADEIEKYKALYEQEKAKNN